MRAFIIFLSVTLIFFSCRKEKNADVEIVITSPAANTSFYQGDTIHVEADISDDDDLNSVTIKLLDQHYNIADHQLSLPINASSYHLSADFVIEDLYISTGNYFLTLTVNGAGLTSSAEKTIFIHGIPKDVKDVYILTRPDTNHVSVIKLDSLNQMIHRFDVAGDYTGSALNARSGQLNIVGKTYGGFNQFDLSTGTADFSEPAYNVSMPSFLGMSFSNGLAFVSYYDGRINAFDQAGHLQFNSEQPVYYQPGSLSINEKYVFVEAYYPGPDEYRLVMLNYPSGIPYLEYNLRADVVSMSSDVNDNAFIFANKNGDGKIYRFHRIGNYADDLSTLFGNHIYSAATIDVDYFALATQEGLYIYSIGMNSLTPFDTGDPVYSVEYDDVHGLLYANCGRKIKTYQYPNYQVVNTIQSGDSVLDVRILYNK